MTRDTLDSSCHCEVWTILSGRADLARTSLRVRVECAGLARLLNDEARLAEITNRAWVALVDQLALGCRRLRAFFADVAGIAVPVVVLKQDGS